MRLALTLCFAGLLLGCARGAAGPLSDDADASLVIDTDSATAGGAGGGAAGGGDSAGGDTAGGAGGDTAGGADTNGGNAGTANGEPDAGDDAGSDASGGGTGSTGCSGSGSGGCTNPQDLGELVGNDGGPAITRAGTGSAWFKITVTDDSTINGYVETLAGIGVTLTTSQAADNYDLFLYRDGDTSCSDDPFASTNASGDENLDHIWNATGPIDAAARTLTIEVRQVSASCGAWSLSITPHPCSQATAPGGDTCATR